MMDETVIAEYRAFLIKVDVKFGDIQNRNQTQMQCGSGCHQCCLPQLTVFEIERENIRQHLEQNPELVQKLRQLAKNNPHQGQRCQFLEANGNCAVYEVRPLVCRSHGAPLYFKEGVPAKARLDVCELNFRGLKSLGDLTNSDFINLDLINQVLALLNQKCDPTGQRYPLNVEIFNGRG